MKNELHPEVRETDLNGNKGIDMPDKRIETFKDLLEEEQRLTMKLKREKAVVVEGLHLLKQKVEPASQFLNGMNKVFGVQEKPGFVAQGVDMAMDLFAKKYVFKRSGWLMTLVGSYAMRGISQFILRKNRHKENAQHAHNGVGL